ncbi:STAS domain-containing protein [Actinosynnema sp. NPDC050436]|uniref:STAS domain-containing protein n=1 Tax=Actinosynnema sp. NPDC050436 TaxID=3155659 RepID=UPI0033F0895D
MPEEAWVDEALPLQVDVRDRASDTVVVVSGELDFATTPHLWEAVGPLARSGRPLVLDLAALSFCDSSALSILVRLHRTAQGSGGSLVLAAPQPQVEAALTVTMLHRLLTIRPEQPDGDPV